jgi:type IV secretory pathway component VirB8
MGDVTMDNDYIDFLLDDEKLSEELAKAETIEEKQLIALLWIRNNLKSIKAWVTFFGVLAIISIIVTILF